jgi:hypothetical protein
MSYDLDSSLSGLIRKYNNGSLYTIWYPEFLYYEFFSESQLNKAHLALNRKVSRDKSLMYDTHKIVHDDWGSDWNPNKIPPVSIPEESAFSPVDNRKRKKERLESFLYTPDPPIEILLFELCIFCSRKTFCLPISLNHEDVKATCVFCSDTDSRTVLIDLIFLYIEAFIPIDKDKAKMQVESVMERLRYRGWHTD